MFHTRIGDSWFFNHHQKTMASMVHSSSRLRLIRGTRSNDIRSGDALRISGWRSTEHQRTSAHWGWLSVVPVERTGCSWRNARSCRSGWNWLNQLPMKTMSKPARRRPMMVRSFMWKEMEEAICRAFLFCLAQTYNNLFYRKQFVSKYFPTASSMTGKGAGSRRMAILARSKPE